jgi:hypothetical protein
MLSNLSRTVVNNRVVVTLLASCRSWHCIIEQPRPTTHEVLFFQAVGFSSSTFILDSSN